MSGETWVQCGVERSRSRKFRRGLGKDAFRKPDTPNVITPLKFNMEPENQPLEKEIPMGNHHFQIPC